VLIIFEIWAFIVMILAIANQQKTSALKAFAVIITPIVIILLIALLFSLGIFGSPSTLSSTFCIPSPTFYCNIPKLHSGTLSVVLAQNTGANINNATLCFVSGNTTPSSCSGYPSYYVGSWLVGRTINASFSGSGIPITTGSKLSGSIFVSYDGSMQRVATVMATAT
jgi:hypothetical protein